jgi:Xaa-Pro dipeptidase
VLSGKPTGRKLEKNEMIWIDMGAVVDGYWSDFCRAAYFGRPTKELEDGQSLIREVNEAMIAAARPGQPVRKVAEAAAKAFANRGLEISLGSGRIGHGIGLMSTEPPHVALYDETICEEGLVFTIEPRITNEHGVFNCEELLAITKASVDVLTTASREITYIN